MVLSDDVEGHLDVGNEHVPVPDVDTELVLQGLVDVYAGVDVDVAALIPPVGVEGNGHSLSDLRTTFQRSGSTLLRVRWTHLMMRLANRPGCLRVDVRDGGFRCVWERGDSRTWAQWLEHAECQPQLV